MKSFQAKEINYILLRMNCGAEYLTDGELKAHLDMDADDVRGFIRRLESNKIVRPAEGEYHAFAVDIAAFRNFVAGENCQGKKQNPRAKSTQLSDIVDDVWRLKETEKSEAQGEQGEEEKQENAQDPSAELFEKIKAARKNKRKDPYSIDDILAEDTSEEDPSEPPAKEDDQGGDLPQWAPITAGIDPDLPPRKKEYAPSLFTLCRSTHISVSASEILASGATVVETLSYFHLRTKVAWSQVGPSVIRHQLELAPDTDVNAVIKRKAELALRLHAMRGVRVGGSGKEAFVELARDASDRVAIRDLLEEMRPAQEHDLIVPIGRGLDRKPVLLDLRRQEGILLSGSTGAGLGTALLSMCVSFLARYSPERLRLTLIDPRKDVLCVFAGGKHLMTPIAQETKDIRSAILGLYKEYKRRTALPSNAQSTVQAKEMPDIVLMIDGLEGIALWGNSETERAVCTLAHEGGTAGIYVVATTRQHSALSQEILSAFSSRIALRMICETDSRSFLDEAGAEVLNGMGDMIVKVEGCAPFSRVQGAYVTWKEAEMFAQVVNKKISPFMHRKGSNALPVEPLPLTGSREQIEALKVVIKNGVASVPLLMRECKMGYNLAVNTLEWMELLGYISLFDGKHPERKVLITREQFERIYGPLD